MRILNQNSALESLDIALVKSSDLIDSRTEQDLLSFLVNYASLINFYDHHNHIDGDWTPFLLKDPVFLLASIAKTNFKQLHILYVKTSLNVEQTLTKDQDSKKVAQAIHQLFDQLLDVFAYIEQWTHFMQKSDKVYPLKKYVLHEVEHQYSMYLWAVITLRQQLYVNNMIPDVDIEKTNTFDLCNTKIWRQHKDKTPYWKILGLQHPITENTVLAIYQSLVSVGDVVFTFFSKIIEYASVEFKDIEIQKSKFPDTTLLRVFVRLLEQFKNQLNTISGKHLEFYYKDILKQSRQSAAPDKVFICTTLAKRDQIFNLPIHTLFDAGQDVNKNPILYESIKDVSLNPAQVVSAYTLVKRNVSEEFVSLFLKKIPNPGSIQKDEDGQLQKWNTFGSTESSLKTPSTMGIAFASPMFFLKEGVRTITLGFSFVNLIDKKFIEMMRTAKFYLSTKKGWLTTSFPKKTLKDTGFGWKLEVTLVLSVSEPGIEAFLKNPDGYNSSWPILKIEFSELANISSPPILKSLQIKTEVTGLKDFTLYNDYGALDTKAPFQPLGPTPSQNSNFFMGSAEIFSKPLDRLTIELDWNNLPENFSKYYEQYNNYLQGKYNDSNNTKGEKKTDFFDEIKKTFKKSSRESSTPSILPLIYFYNQCFKVKFQLWQDRHSSPWVNFDMINKNIEKLKEENVDIHDDSNDIDIRKPKAQQLFNTKKNNNHDKTNDDTGSLDVLADKSVFIYSGESKSEISIDPNIQKTVLKFTEKNAFGFMKMQLVKPGYGFGKDIYANVVSIIALQNAIIAIRDAKAKSNTYPFIPPANVPFSPQAKLFSANYTASTTYTFDYEKEEYPIECYYYSPFQNYKVYDNTKDTLKYKKQQGMALGSPPKGSDYLPLFPAFSFEGALFLELKEVLSPGKVNLYIELAPGHTHKMVANTANDRVTYTYLSTQGWKKLTVLSDGTNNFKCSGIITFNLPDDITDKQTIMPDNSYWLSLGVTNTPDSYAQTIFLKSNGFELKRTENDGDDTSTIIPRIKSDTIKAPHTAIPQVSSITQPFPSFGGRAYETELQMNRRVSTRIQTKDRLVTSTDYFRIIKQEYPSIYYSKTVFNKETNKTNVFVVKKYAAWTDANAFTPLVNQCEEGNIENYLRNRASAFANIKVSNFQFRYVGMHASIIIKAGSESQGVIKQIQAGVNILLSPWISSDQEQIEIDKGLSTAQVAGYIESFAAVIAVDNIDFLLGERDAKSGTIIFKEAGQNINPQDPSILLVPALTYTIKYHID